MIRNILLFAAFIPCLAWSQVRVIHYSQLPQEWQQACRPDVEGYVLVADKLPASVVSPDSIFPYPGWPVTTVTGSQKLGGTWANIAGDERMEILFTIGQNIYAWMLDGTSVPGWPVNLTYYPDGPPAIGDIDGDGLIEVVVATRSGGTANSGKIHAFEMNGTPVAGFPVTLNGGPTNTTCLADVDGLPGLEILVTERNYPDGKVGIYKGDGTALAGWPQTMDYIPGSAVAAADVDNDGIVEVFAESYYQVWGWKADGSMLPGWPYLPGTDRVFSYSTPVIADINQDGTREIIVGDHSLGAGNGMVHVIRSNGTALTGWPRSLGYWIYSPCAIGDVDADGQWDIVTGDQVLSGSPVDELAAWDYAGNYLPGFPVVNIDAINIQPLICNLDNDSRVEIMIDDNTASGLFHVYNHDATPLTGQGYPLQVSGQSFYINPFAADLNKDNMLEVAAAGYTSTGTLTSIHVFGSDFPYMAELAYTTTIGFNVQHDGLFIPPSTVGSGETFPLVSGPSLHVFPNPSIGNILISSLSDIQETCTICIFDITGNVLFSETVQGNKLQSWYSINLCGWKPGLYMLSLRTLDGLKLEKFIIH